MVYHIKSFREILKLSSYTHW